MARAGISGLRWKSGFLCLYVDEANFSPGSVCGMTSLFVGFGRVMLSEEKEREGREMGGGKGREKEGGGRVKAGRESMDGSRKAE